MTTTPTTPQPHTGVRCMCVLTGCRAGPGCPHYGANCRKHIEHVAQQPTTPQPLTQPEPLSDERIKDFVRRTTGHPAGDSLVGRTQLREFCDRVESATAEAWRSHIAARDAEVAALLGVLREVREAIHFANESPGGAISDTIWMMHRPETLLDFIDAAIDRAGGKA